MSTIENARPRNENVPHIVLEPLFTGGGYYIYVNNELVGVTCDVAPILEIVEKHRTLCANCRKHVYRNPDCANHLSGRAA